MTLGAARPCHAWVLATSAFASVLQERGGPPGRLEEACRSCIEASGILISIDLRLLFLLSSFRFPTWCFTFIHLLNHPVGILSYPFLLPAGCFLGGLFHSSLPTPALPSPQPTNPHSSLSLPAPPHPCHFSKEASFPDSAFLSRTLFPSFFTFSSFKNRCRGLALES